MAEPDIKIPGALVGLFQKHFGTAPTAQAAVTAHASERSLFRLWAGDHSVIGVSYRHTKENAAFVYLSEVFAKLGLKVPSIIAFSKDQTAYLQSDLGTSTLYDMLQAQPGTPSQLSPPLRTLYEEVLRQLPRIQFEAGAVIDFGRCLAPQRHDAQAIQSDLDAFRKEFLTRTFSEPLPQELQAELVLLAQWLAAAPQELGSAARPVFMYRDFQSRNVMVLNGEPYFIDYQGGRRGPIPYDLVSMLYQSSAGLSTEDREHLRGVYVQEAVRHPGFCLDSFARYYESFILLRMLQVLGTYGRQGLGLGKAYFQQSIPKALQTALQVLPKVPLLLPQLTKIFEQLNARDSWTETTSF